MSGLLGYFCAEWRRARRLVRLDWETFTELADSIEPDGSVCKGTRLAQQFDIEGWRLDIDDAVVSDSLPDDMLSTALCEYMGVGHITSQSCREAGILPAAPRLGRRSPECPAKASSVGSSDYSPSPVVRADAGCSHAIRDTKHLSVASTGPSPSPVVTADSGCPPVASAPTTILLEGEERSASPEASRSGYLRAKSPRLLRSRSPLDKSNDKKMFLFRNPSHPLESMCGNLTRNDFLKEIPKCLSAELFFNSGAREPSLTTEETEDLFHTILIVQNKPGRAWVSEFQGGRQFDELVEGFVDLSQLRVAVERGANCFSEFFNKIDNNKDGVVDRSELEHFIKTVPGFNSSLLLSRSAKFIQSLFLHLGTNHNNQIELAELRRQLSLAAPRRFVHVELAAHLEFKYGVGKNCFQNVDDCREFFEFFVNKEMIDISPEDAARFYRIFIGANTSRKFSDGRSASKKYFANQTFLLDKAFGALLDAVPCGMDTFISQQAYEVMGLRAAVCAKSQKWPEAQLPMEALADEDDSSIDHKEIERRFEILWVKTIATSVASKPQSTVTELRRSLLNRYSDTILGFTPNRRPVKEARHRPLTPLKESRHRPLTPLTPNPSLRSLFANIADVISIPFTIMRSNQLCLVRYRLNGAASFWSDKHTVLKNGRDPISWPIDRSILGSTPFIGLVRKDDVNAMGSGAPARLEPVVRVDLPRDPSSDVLLMSARVSLHMPSVERMSKHSEDFELRLFCSNKQKAIGWVGEAVPVTVVRDSVPPPLEALQVRFEGRNATVRWGVVDLKNLNIATSVEQVRLNMRTEDTQRTWCLDRDVTEWEISDLAPDTDYEFHARLENRAGAGREITSACRTNSVCSAPGQVHCAETGITFVRVKFQFPQKVGNESTKDRFQVRRETISKFEATLRLEDDEPECVVKKASERASQTCNETSKPGRKCTWTKSSWEMHRDDVTVRIDGLRPDTQYALERFCGTNSMGTGLCAPRFVFWTTPQKPKISGVRVKRGLVLIALSQTGGLSVKEFVVHVIMGAEVSEDQENNMFKLPRVNLDEDLTDKNPTVPELSIRLNRMPVAESQSQRFKVRAKNTGGWSEWSDFFETEAVKRQQSAKQAQTHLINAIEARDIQLLRDSLKNVETLELPDEKFREEGIELLNVLQDVQSGLTSALNKRDPEQLRQALAAVQRVQLPGSEEAEMLLIKLDAVVENLRTAKGIHNLREALEAAREAQLPHELQQEAIDRLATREAAQLRFKEAMRAARAPVLQIALEHAQGMHLPAEGEAVTLLSALKRTEAMLNAALETRLIGDLESALDTAKECGSREDALIDECTCLLDTLLRERDNAQRTLRACIREKHPDRLREMILIARSAQVNEGDLQIAQATLETLDEIVRRNVDAVGMEERVAALELTKDGALPKHLSVPFVEQYDSLLRLQEGLKIGHVEVLRQRLRRAESAGAKEVEMAKARATYSDWSSADRELQVSGTLRETARLNAAIERASSLGISTEQLSLPKALHDALERHDAAEEMLVTAMKDRQVEALQTAMRRACDAGVENTDLMKEAGSLVERLTGLRDEMMKALKHAELYEASAVLERCSTTLPEAEVVRLSELVDELQQKEREKIVGSMQESITRRDWRCADWLLRRNERSRDAGAEVHRMLEGLAKRVCEEAPREDIARFVSDLTADRSRRHYHEWGEELSSASERIQPIPTQTVTGDVSLIYEPCGVHVYTFPREVVEGYLRIHMENERDMELNIEDGTGTDGRTLDVRILEELTGAIRRQLPSQDEVIEYADLDTFMDGEGAICRREPGRVLRTGCVEREIAVYVRSDLHVLDYCRALVSIASTSEKAWIDQDVGNGCPCAGEAETGHPCASQVSAPTEIAAQGVNLSHAEIPRYRSLADHTRGIKSRWLRRVSAELSWEYPRGLLDYWSLSCLVYDADHLIGVVDERHKDGGWTKPTPTFCSENKMAPVWHEGSTMDYNKRRGSQTIQLRLDLMAEKISDFVFVLSTFSHNMTKFKNVKLTFYDQDTMRVLTSIPLEQEASTAESVVSCSLYRLNDGLWRVNSFGCACTGNVRKYMPIASKLADIGFPRHAWLRCQVPTIIESIQQQLRLSPQLISQTLKESVSRPHPRSQAAGIAKVAGVEILHASLTEPLKSQITLQFVVELYGLFGERSSEIYRTMGRRFFVTEILKALKSANDSIFDAASGKAGDRLRDAHLFVGPAARKQLMDVEVRMSWTQPHICRRDAPGAWLDGACVVFEDQGLREVVDYRGAHGIRIVQGGVIDYSGVWVGKVGVSDATGNAVTYCGDGMDHVSLRGENSIRVQLDQLPKSTTDLYFILSSPTPENASSFSDLSVRVVASDNPLHEVLAAPVTPQASGKAIMMCRLSLNSASGFWSLETLGTRASGNARDYRPIISCLRAMQERKQARRSQWPSRSVKLAGQELGKTGLSFPALTPAAVAAAAPAAVAAAGTRMVRLGSKRSDRSTTSVYTDASPLSNWTADETPESSSKTGSNSDEEDDEVVSMPSTSAKAPMTSSYRRAGSGFFTSLRRMTMPTLFGGSNGGAGEAQQPPAPPGKSKMSVLPSTAPRPNITSSSSSSFSSAVLSRTDGAIVRAPPPTFLD